MLRYGTVTVGLVGSCDAWDWAPQQPGGVTAGNGASCRLSASHRNPAAHFWSLSLFQSRVPLFRFSSSPSSSSLLSPTLSFPPSSFLPFHLELIYFDSPTYLFFLNCIPFRLIFWISILACSILPLSFSFLPHHPPQPALAGSYRARLFAPGCYTLLFQSSPYRNRFRDEHAHEHHDDVTMSPMLMNSMSDGPAIALSPRQDHPFQFPSAQPKLDATSTNFRAYAANSGPGFTNGMNPVPSKPSRKRSRDVAGFEEAMNNTAPVEPPAPAPAPTPVEEPIYGEGMVLLNPRTGVAVSAESQTGTWYEEKAEQAVSEAPPVSSRSVPDAGLSEVQSRKSKRLDPSASGLDDIALSSMQNRLQNTTNDDNRRILNAGNTSGPEPLVDDATHLLGISWQRVGGADDDMALAVRGWKKYIDNQYSTHLQDSQILMKNRALNAFLVAAQPATMMPVASPTLYYYLFSDDLDQARLVSSTWETCVQNLRCVPVVFEGADVLVASDKRNGTANANAPLGSNAMETGVPLLQSLSAQPISNGGIGMDGGVGGMEIDS